MAQHRAPRETDILAGQGPPPPRVQRTNLVEQHWLSDPVNPSAERDWAQGGAGCLRGGEARGGSTPASRQPRELLGSGKQEGSKRKASSQHLLLKILF